MTATPIGATSLLEACARELSDRTQRRLCGIQPEPKIFVRIGREAHLLLLLTPEGDDPDGEDWVQISYADVADIIDGLTRGASVLAPEVSLANLALQPS